MLETFYIIFVGLQKIIAIKDAILHLKKIMLFLLRWKKKNSVVIILFVFYPLETLGNGAKNRRRLDYTRPTDSIYPILWVKKQVRFSAIYANRKWR